MKILFINLPYDGHVVPTIGLVQELIKQGCEVTYLMSLDWRDKIADSGAQFYGYKNHKKLSVQPVNARCIERLGVGKRLEYSKVNVNTLKQTVFSVASDCNIKENLEKVQRLIEQASGNKDGAEAVIRYYNEWI